MARFLFVVPPLTGHTNPTVAVGTELMARGHDVAWCGFANVLRPLVPEGATVVPLGDDLPADMVSAVEERSQGLRGAKALKFLWEDFLHPLGDAMVPGVDAAVASFRPDVMIVDQQAIAGALVARRHGLPWATSATTSADLVDPFALLPKLRDWVDASLVEFQVSHGVGPDEARPEAMRLSDDLVLAFTTTELVGVDGFPAHFAFVGPAFGGRPSACEFPWDWLDPDRAHVLVSLGTVNATGGVRFYRAAIDALADQPWQAVLVAPPDRLIEPDDGPLPDNLLVRERVPQLDLLPHLDAVVSHGGHNTVCETLAHGLPLVVAPIKDDQPIVAEQVERSGAGLRVKYGRVGAAELRANVQRVLDESSFRDAATRIQDSFRQAGGAVAAADHLEKLAVR